jgi:hypothetical protein
MLSDNGCSYSHTETASNCKKVGVKFSEGQLVQVAVKEDKVVFDIKT